MRAWPTVANALALLAERMKHNQAPATQSAPLHAPETEEEAS